MNGRENGRELVAEDIVFNFHRTTGTGSGFTEKSPFAGNVTNLPIESIEATDKYTVEFKLTRPHLGALRIILEDRFTSIYPPEVIKQHGDAKDWRNLVGTGPFMWTDWVEGSSYTYTKNPDYWGYDEKYPENRLPYIDELRALFIKEPATRLAALRTAKIDFLGAIGGSPIRDMGQLESLNQTNPEIVVTKSFRRSETCIIGDVRKPPFDDIRVRQAMQVALDLETINATFFKGYGQWKPQGQLGNGLVGYNNPFEECPEELKLEYTYDPERAEALLDEAGYPRGADGIRFKTPANIHQAFATGYYQIAAEYWRQIGVDVEIRVLAPATFNAMSRAKTYEGMSWALAGAEGAPLTLITPYHSRTWGWANWGAFQDPVLNAKIEAVEAATTIEEQKRLLKEADMYLIEIHHVIWGPKVPWFSATQPWVIGHNGEANLGPFDSGAVLARLWIDQELKDRSQ